MQTKSTVIDQADLFHSRRDQILNRRHPLYRLADSIDLSVFDKDFCKLYVENIGHYDLLIRLLVGLHYLKHAFIKSDGKSLIDCWKTRTVNTSNASSISSITFLFIRRRWSNGESASTPKVWRICRQLPLKPPSQRITYPKSIWSGAMSIPLSKKKPLPFRQTLITCWNRLDHQDPKP